MSNESKRASGAIRLCAPVPGDAYLIEEVGDRFELQDQSDITDEMLEETFGPNWAKVVNIVRQAASMTPEQVVKLAAAEAPRAAARAARAAWVAVNATWDSARVSDRIARSTSAAIAAAKAALDAAAWDAGQASRAAADAASAVALFHLIGQHGYTQEHHDTLMAPWISVFGEVTA